MKTFWDKTPEELSQEIAKQNVSEVHKQTVFLLEILKQVGEAIEANKTVKVENIIRQVVGKVAVERPEWLNELKQDIGPLQKKLDYIASAIIRKEVVKKVDVNRPEWLSELVPKDIKVPEPVDFTKPTVETLKLILKEIKDREVVKEVTIASAVEIKEPEWFRLPDIGLLLSGTYKKLVAFMEDNVFDVRVQNEISVDVKNRELSVKVLNHPDEVKIENISKITDRLDLLSSQLRAIGTTGSNAATGTASTGSGGDGAILDGVSSAVKATVKDLANSNPLAVAIVDAAGDQVSSFGGGTQYTEGDADASITGTAAMVEGAANALIPMTQPLTDTQLRAADVKVTLDGESVPVTGVFYQATQPVSAASLPLPTGAATQTTLAAVDTKLQSLIDKAAGSAVIKKTIALASSGNVHTPVTGKKIRIFNLKFSLSADMTDVAFKFGSGSAFEKYLAPKTGGLYGSNTHPDYYDGAVDEILKCDITGTGTVQINLEYVEV